MHFDFENGVFYSMLRNVTKLRILNFSLFIVIEEGEAMLASKRRFPDSIIFAQKNCHPDHA
ncbi:MAG TPA: hypothetical protein VLI68_04270 [Hanamia sp.]|nr:hypothetical protein [Hanamia sp.]